MNRNLSDRPVARILAVGIAALDIVIEVAEYPGEDAEVRALGQRRVRGGNAANTLAVLAQLGQACAFAGTLADDPAGDFLRADLAGRGVDLSRAVAVPGAATPTSYIWLSRATGSRTIVHHRQLRELEAADFERMPLDGLDWVHFEGRHPAETARMIARVRRERPAMPVSVELEKPRPGIAALLDGADLLLVSRAFALASGAPAQASPAAWLQGLAARTSARLLVLGWGAQGAWSLERGSEPKHCPAHPPERVVDTIGAGDVLNAGVIDGLLRGLAARAAVRAAVRLAGLKCGQSGLDHLGVFAHSDPQVGRTLERGNEP